MSLFDHLDITVDTELTADVVIVGTGPGGAAAGRVLAEAGLSVIWLEEGPKESRFRPNQANATRYHYQEGGSMISSGSTLMPITAGRGVGGGSLVNSALAFRAPDYVLEEWAELTGDDGFSPENAGLIYDEISAIIGVGITRAKIGGENNALIVRGVRALGYEGGWAPRNTPGCVGCALCNTGCLSGGKGSVDRNLIVMARAAGAKVYADTKVDQVLVEDGRAVGLSGQVSHPDTGEPVARLTVRAAKVMISAGAIGTPRLLFHAGIADQLGPAVGKGLRVHPGSAVLGLCDHDVNMWTGATQGAYFHVPGLPGVLPHTFNAPPEVVVMSLMSAGMGGKEAMDVLGKVCGVIVLVSDHGDGSVTATHDGRANIKYYFVEDDLVRIKAGMIASAHVLIAGGAKTLFAPVRGLGFYDSVAALEEALLPTTLDDFTNYSAHPMATCRMGRDPETSVVGPTGEAHRMPGLFLADSSVFPTSLGVNPQLTTMMTATVIAKGMI
jgi:choline dehydrogenase-like flavoprotein